MNDNRDNENRSHRDIRFDIESDNEIKASRPGGFDSEKSNNKKDIFLDPEEDDVKFDLGEFKPKKVKSALTEPDLEDSDSAFSMDKSFDEPDSFEAPKAKKKPLSDLFTSEKPAQKKDITQAKQAFTGSESRELPNGKKRPTTIFGLGHKSADDSRREKRQMEKIPKEEVKLSFNPEEPNFDPLSGKTKIERTVDDDSKFELPSDTSLRSEKAKSKPPMQTSSEDVAYLFRTPKTVEKTPQTPKPIKDRPQQELAQPTPPVKPTSPQTKKREQFQSAVMDSKMQSPLPIRPTNHPSGLKPITVDEVLTQDEQDLYEKKSLENHNAAVKTQLENEEVSQYESGKSKNKFAKRQNRIPVPMPSKREFVNNEEKQISPQSQDVEFANEQIEAPIKPKIPPEGSRPQQTETDYEITDEFEKQDINASDKREPVEFKTAVIPTNNIDDDRVLVKREKPKFVINPVPIPPEVIENRRPARPKKRRKKKKRTSVLGMCVRIFVALMLLSALTVGTMGIVYAMGDLLGLKESEELIQVTIEPDTPVPAVARTLKANGIINYPQVFQMYIKYHLKNQVAFKFGTFSLHPSMAYDEIIKALEEATGNVSKLRFTIREGENISAIADDLQADGICQRDEFLEAVRTHPFENEYLAEVTNPEQRYYKLEGYLFPNTYEFVQNTPPDEIINTLLNEFTNQIDGNNIYNLAADLDKTLRIASIVQAEAPTKQEMMKVASIYWNRLNNPDMFSMLQSDPTSKYAERVLTATGAPQNIADAYDTYKSQGLPPGPINNPGMQAIIATLYPANTNYYYFCTDASGAFYYATTYEEHQNNLALAGIDENNLD